MHMLAADHQIDAGYGQNDGKQDDGSSGRVRGVAAAGVEHIVNIAHDGIHLRRIQLCAEQGNRVAICFESADKAGDHQIK